MLEKSFLNRYTTASIQAIFFARAEASLDGALSVDTQHILMGIVHVDSETVRNVAPGLSLESIRSQAAYRHSLNEQRVPVYADMPLSEQAGQALEAAESIADKQASTRIRTEHLLLALVTMPSSHTAILFDEAGGSIPSLQERINHLTGDEEQVLSASLMEDIGKLLPNLP